MSDTPRTTPTETFAAQIRSVLAQYNDPELPVTHLVGKLKAEVEKLSKLNHDISIGEMIDKADEEAIGLLERPAELQFVRLASAFNALKVEVKKLQSRIKELLNDDNPEVFN